jgi:hypothetical protein
MLKNFTIRTLFVLLSNLMINECYAEIRPSPALAVQPMLTAERAQKSTDSTLNNAPKRHRSKIKTVLIAAVPVGTTKPTLDRHLNGKKTLITIAGIGAAVGISFLLLKGVSKVAGQ